MALGDLEGGLAAAGRASSAAGMRVFSGCIAAISFPSRFIYTTVQRPSSRPARSAPRSRNVTPMGCFVALFALISPRLALFALFLFSDLLSRAYEDWIVPFIGFFLLPWTTLAYAVMWSVGTHGVKGFEWFLVILAFLFDLGSWREGRGARRRA